MELDKNRLKLIEGFAEGQVDGGSSSFPHVNTTNRLILGTSLCCTVFSLSPAQVSYN